MIIYLKLVLEIRKTKKVDDSNTNMTSNFTSIADLQRYLESFYNEDNNKKIYNFFDSSLNSKLIPKQKLASHLDSNFLNKDYSLGYSYPHGLIRLRKKISHRYLGDPSEYKDILITNGAQEALYIILRLLKETKNKQLNIAVEEFSYIGFEHIIKTLNLNLIRISLEKDGISLKNLEQQLVQNQIDALYIIPDIQNPTGVTLSQTKRKKIAKLQKRYNFKTIYDLAYTDLYFDKADKISLQPQLNENTYLVGSFSKTIAPAFRAGWLYKRQLNDETFFYKRMINLFQPTFLQRTLADFIDSDYPKHLKKITKILEYKQEYLIYLLNYFGLNKYFSWIKPNGGFYLWLNASIDIIKKIDKFHSKALLIAPGTFFNPVQGNNYIRLCYSNLTVFELLEAIKRMASIFVEEKRTTPNLYWQTLKTLLRIEVERIKRK